MSRVILLNGCGSSGKTSIARSIGHLSEDLWLTFGVDTFISMLPYMKEDQYFSLIPSKNDRGPTTRVEIRSRANQLFGTLPDFAKLLADRGNNIIIDEVLFSDEQLLEYANSLKNHTVYFIGVFCDLPTMQEREILRRDRSIGLSNDQIDRVHLGLCGNYDLKVDTTSVSPFETAKQILAYVKNNAHPKNFQEFILRG